MRSEWLAFIIAVPLWAQAPVKTGLKLADFYAHDPCILADRESRTYYLYTAAIPPTPGRTGPGL